MPDTSYIMNLVVRAENAINAIDKFKALSEQVPDFITVDMAMKSNDLDAAAKVASRFGESIGLAGSELERFVTQLIAISSYLGSGKSILAGGPNTQFNQLADSVKANLPFLSELRDRLASLYSIKGLTANSIPEFIDFNKVLSSASDRLNAIFSALGRTGAKPQIVSDIIRLSQVIDELIGRIPKIGEEFGVYVETPIKVAAASMQNLRAEINNVAQGFTLVGQAVSPFGESFSTASVKLDKVQMTVKDLLAISKALVSEGLLGKNVSSEADAYSRKIDDIRKQLSRVMNSTRGGLISGALNADEFKALLPIIDQLRNAVNQLKVEQMMLNYLAGLSEAEYKDTSNVLVGIISLLRQQGVLLNDSAIASALIARNIGASGITGSTALVPTGTSESLQALINSERQLLSLQILLTDSINNVSASISNSRSNIAGLIDSVSSASASYRTLSSELGNINSDFQGLQNNLVPQNMQNVANAFMELTQKGRDLRAKLSELRSELSAVQSQIKQRTVAGEGFSMGPNQALLDRERVLIEMINRTTTEYNEARDAGIRMAMDITKSASSATSAQSNLNYMIGAGASAANQTASSVNNLANASNRAALAQQKNAGAAKQASGDYFTLAGNIRKLITDIASFSSKGERMFSALDSSLKDFSYFMSIAIEKIIRYRVAFYLMQKSIELFKNTFVFAKDVQLQFAELDRILIRSGANIVALRDAAFEMARTFGVAVKDISEVMTIWAQQGKTQNEIIALTRTTTIAMVTANLDAKTAVEALTAAQRIYNISAEDSIIVFDKILNVERLYAVTTQDLAEAIKLLGSTAEEFGMSMDELLASVTAVGQVTRRSGSQVANSLKTIFANFTQTDTLTMLREFGVAVNDTFGNLMPMGKVLDQLSTKWSNLTESQRISIAKTVGGVRHYTSFIVLMDQYAVKLKATADAAESIGFSNEALAKKVNTLSASIKKLSATFQQLIVATGESTFGFANTVNGLIKLFDIMAGGKDKLSTFQRTMAEINGFLLTFASSLLLVKGIQLGFQLAVTKSMEAISASAITNTKVMSTTLVDSVSNSLKTAGLGASGLTTRGLLGHLKPSKTQLNEAAAALRAIKIGQEVTVQLGTEMVTLQKVTAAAAAQINILGNSSVSAATKMSLLSSVGLKLRGVLQGFGAIFAGLYKAVGGWIGLLLMAAITVLPAFINKIRHTNDEATKFKDTVQNNVSSLLDGVAAQKKYLSNLVNLGAQFQKFSNEFNSLAGKPEEQAKAFGALISVYERIKGLDPTYFSQFDDEDLKNLSNQSKIMTKVYSELDDRSNNYIKSQTNAAVATQKQIGLLKSNITTLGLLSSSVDQYAKAKELALKIDINSLKTNDATIRSLTSMIRKQSLYWESARTGQKAYYEEQSTFTKRPHTNLSRLGEAVSYVNVKPTINENINILDNYYNSLRNIYEQWDKLKGEITDKDLSDVGFTKESFETFERALQDLARNISFGKKAIKITDFIDLSGGARVFENFAALLRNKMGDETNKLTELFNKLKDQIDNVQGSLGLTTEEWKKLYKEIATGIAKAKISFQDLGKSITSDLQEALYEDKPSSYFDIVIKNAKETKDRIESVTEAYDIQLREMIITRSLVKSLGEEQRKRYEDELKYIQSQIYLNQKSKDKAQETIDLYNKGDSKISQDMFEKARNDIAELNVEMIGFKRNANDISRQIAPTLGTGEINAAVSEFIEGAKQSAAISEQTANLLINLNQMQAESLDNEIAQLTLKKNRASEYLDVEKKSIELQLMDARLGKLSLSIIEKEMDLKNRMLTINRDISKEVISKLEFGETAVAYSYEKQNKQLEMQIKIWEQISNAAKIANLSPGSMLGMYDLIVNRNGDWRDVIDEISAGYEKVNAKDLPQFISNLQQVLGFLEKEKILELQSLNIQRDAANAIDFVRKRTDDYTKKLQKSRDLSIEISKLLDDRSSAVSEEVNKWQDSLMIQQESKSLLVDTIGFLKEKKKISVDEADAMLEQISSIGKAQKMNVELFGALFRDKLQKVAPILENMKNRANDIATAFTSSFSDIPSLLVSRYTDIASANDEIYYKIEDINRLQKDLGRLTADDADEYIQLTAEIKNAEIELSRMRDDLKEMSSLKGFLGDVFGNMAKNIASLISKIQESEMQTALESLLKESTFGEKLTSLFTTASEKGAISYARGLQNELDNFSKTFQKVFRSEGDRFLEKLEQVLSKVVPETTSKIIESNNDFGSGLQLQSFSDELKRYTYDSWLSSGLSSNTAIEKIAQDFSMEDKLRVWNDMSEFLKLISINTKDSVKSTGELSTNTSVFLKSIATMFSIQAGTALGANLFGKGNAGGANTGATIGSGLMSSIIKDKKLASYLGFALPVVGSLAGGILGGWISSIFKKERKPSIEPYKPDRTIKDNTSALRENTSAIVGLSTELIDLRDQLINAPARFSMPNRYNYGQASVGFVGQTYPTNMQQGYNMAPSINITVNGNMNSDVGQQIVQEISAIYSQQSRVNSSNFRMPR